MNNDFRFERNQLLALAAVILLSPALRLFPSVSAELAGRGAWLSALCAFFPLGLYAVFLSRFMACREEGEGLGELLLRCTHPRAGRWVLAFLGAGLTLYAAFVLRSGADRFITTVYPDSSPEVFELVMGALALTAALGSARAMARVAKMVLPFVAGVVAVILFAALFRVETANLLPLGRRDVLPVLEGAIPAVDVGAAVLVLVCFAEGSVTPEGGRTRSWLWWTGGACAFLCLVSLCVVGSFGAELAARLTRPFFSLVRNLVFFGTVERVEALVVSLWVFPDFLLCSLLLYAAQLCLRLCMGRDGAYRGERLGDVSRGRYIIWLCATAAVILSLFIGADGAGLRLWSERIIPAVNLFVAFVLLPALFAVGKIRRRI